MLPVTSNLLVDSIVATLRGGGLIGQDLRTVRKFELSFVIYHR